MEQLTGLDASFLYLDQKKAPMHIGSLCIYDPSTAPNGFVRFKDILKFIEDRLPMAKTFRQKLARVPLGVDHPYWVEDNDFDLEFHVRHIALPAPGDWRQLCIQAARIFSRPLDMDRPLWEITVIEGLDNVEGVPKGSFAFVTKIHHAGIDGVSGVDIMNALHSITSDVTLPKDIPTWKPERRPTAPEMLLRGYVGALKNPFRWIDLLGRSVPGAARVVKGLIKKEFGIEALRKVPRTRLNHTISANRVFDGRTFSLDDIKAIKNELPGAKVNDVMLAIVGGGLRKYLARHGEVHENPLVALAPISVRSEGEAKQLGNQVSGMLVRLGTHIGDPRERFIDVYEGTQDSKALTNAIGARQISEITKMAPALFTGLAARLYSEFGFANRMRPFFNTIVTNIPGPPIPIYSAGAKMVSFYGMLCLTDGIGLGHIVESYDGRITVSFTACRKLMPDPEFYAECLEESFIELKEAMLGKTASKKSGAKKASAKKVTARKAVSKKTSTKKAVGKKAAPKKITAKKAAPAKAAPKKAGVKKAVAKKVVTKKPEIKKVAAKLDTSQPVDVKKAPVTKAVAEKMAAPKVVIKPAPVAELPLGDKASDGAPATETKSA